MYSKSDNARRSLSNEETDIVLKLKKIVVAAGLTTAIALTTPQLALAQTPAGKLAVVVGSVSRQGTNVKAQDPVFAGDVFKTSAGSFAVLVFDDGTRVTIRPESEFTVESSANETGAGETALSLVTGGLRAVTGLVGKKNPENFKLSTPLGTIGIRGTEFDTRLCADGSCVSAQLALESCEGDATDYKDKLFVPVYNGTVTMSDCDPVIDINAGQTGVASGGSSQCEVLDYFPCVLVNDSTYQQAAWRFDEQIDQQLNSLEGPVLDPDLSEREPDWPINEREPDAAQDNFEPEPEPEPEPVFIPPPPPRPAPPPVFIPPPPPPPPAPEPPAPEPPAPEPPAPEPPAPEPPVPEPPVPEPPVPEPPVPEPPQPEPPQPEPPQPEPPQPEPPQPEPPQPEPLTEPSPEEEGGR